MHPIHALPLILIAALGITLGRAAPFENLGFDLARTNRLSVESTAPLRGTGPAEDLLFGWQLFKGGVPQSTVGLNSSLLSFGFVTLISADQSDYFRFPVQGSYALYLVGSAGNQEPFSLSQRGDIPAEARILSLAYSGYGFSLTMDGRGLLPTQQTTSSEVFDISQFSGQTVNLTLTALGPLMPTQSGSSFLDSIALTIPEPSTLALLACGLAALSLQRRKHAFEEQFTRRTCERQCWRCGRQNRRSYSEWR